MLSNSDAIHSEGARDQHFVATQQFHFVLQKRVKLL